MMCTFIPELFDNRVLCCYTKTMSVLLLFIIVILSTLNINSRQITPFGNYAPNLFTNISKCLITRHIHLLKQ